MKFTFLLFSILTLGETGHLMWQESSRLEQARVEIGQGRLDAGLALLTSLPEKIPQFHDADEAMRLCRLAYGQKAQTLGFQDIGAFLRQPTRCTMGKDEIEANVAAAARDFLQTAKQACGSGEFRQAIEDIDAVRLHEDVPEKLRTLAANEAAWCRLKYAGELLDADAYAASRALLKELDIQDNPALHEEAQGLWVELTRNQVNRLTDHDEWAEADEALDAGRAAVKGSPKAEEALAMVEAAFIARAFAGSDPSGPPKPKTAVAEAEPRSSLTLVNGIGAPMRVVLRGSNHAPMRAWLAAKKSETLELPPGDYFVGLVPNQQGQLSTLRDHINIRPQSHLTYRLIGDGSKLQLAER